MNILIVNVGSTSFKYKLFEMPSEGVLADGRLERIGSDESPVAIRIGDHEETGVAKLPDYATAIRRMMADLTSEYSPLRSLDDIGAVGFKAVILEGEPGCYRIDDDVLTRMEAMNALAPTHSPPYVNTIRQMRATFPDLPLVALFEPHFHVTMPDYARTYGVPEKWERDHSVHRYGFHGASHRYVSVRGPEIAGLDAKSCRMVSAHLGGSSSLCAIRDGKSIDTSMGMSPQSGVEHSTRNGELDVFAVLHVMDREKLSTDDVRKILCKSAGLAGVSGTSGDVRDLEAAVNQGNDRARLALDMFAYNVKKTIGSYAAALGGLDLIAFAGGIGERGVAMRSGILDRLEFLGVRLDSERNARHTGQEGIISADDSPVVVVVVQTNEELVVARDTYRLIEVESHR